MMSYLPSSASHQMSLDGVSRVAAATVSWLIAAARIPMASASSTFHRTRKSTVFTSWAPNSPSSPSAASSAQCKSRLPCTPAPGPLARLSTWQTTSLLRCVESRICRCLVANALASPPARTGPQRSLTVLMRSVSHRAERSSSCCIEVCWVWSRKSGGVSWRRVYGSVFASRVRSESLMARASRLCCNAARVSFSCRANIFIDVLEGK